MEGPWYRFLAGKGAWKLQREGWGSCLIVWALNPIGAGFGGRHKECQDFMVRPLSDHTWLPKQQPSFQINLFVELRLWLDFLSLSELAQELDKPTKGVEGGGKDISDNGSLLSTVIDIWTMVGRAVGRQDLHTKLCSFLLLTLGFIPFSTWKWDCVFGKSQFSLLFIRAPRKP